MQTSFFTLSIYWSFRTAFRGRLNDYKSAHFFKKMRVLITKVETIKSNTNSEDDFVSNAIHV